MSAAILSVGEGVYRRLHRLSTAIGQTPEAVLDCALTDYERKMHADNPKMQVPSAAIEAELLDDPGRIRLDPRNQTTMSARVISIGRRAVRAIGDED